MARHLSYWTHAASRDALVAVLGGTAVLTLALLAVARSPREPETTSVNLSGRAVTVGFAFVFVLGAYPERLIGNLIGHLVTVLIGAVLLFVPMRILLTLLVPLREDGEVLTPIGAVRQGGRWAWGLATLAGILIGGLLVAAEMSEGSGTTPLQQLALVALVYICLTTGGTLIAYACLREPLGLWQRSSGHEPWSRRAVKSDVARLIRR